MRGLLPALALAASDYEVRVDTVRISLKQIHLYKLSDIQEKRKTAISTIKLIVYFVEPC